MLKSFYLPAPCFLITRIGRSATLAGKVFRKPWLPCGRLRTCPLNSLSTSRNQQFFNLCEALKFLWNCTGIHVILDWEKSAWRHCPTLALLESFLIQVKSCHFFLYPLLLVNRRLLKVNASTLVAGCAVVGQEQPFVPGVERKQHFEPEASELCVQLFRGHGVEHYLNKNNSLLRDISQKEWLAPETNNLWALCSALSHWTLLASPCRWALNRFCVSWLVSLAQRTLLSLGLPSLSFTFSMSLKPSLTLLVTRAGRLQVLKCCCVLFVVHVQLLIGSRLNFLNFSQYTVQPHDTFFVGLCINAWIWCV